MTNTQNEENRNNKPVKKLKSGSVQLNVWENQNKDGRVARKFTATRSYRDKDGNWQETSTFFESDLLVIADFFKKAYDWSLEQNRANNDQ